MTTTLLEKPEVQAKETVYEAIHRIVESRNDANTQFSVAISPTERQAIGRRLHLLKKTVYFAELSITIGRGKNAKIPYAKIKLEKEVKDALKSAELESPVMPVFKALKKVSVRIYTLRKKVLDRAKMERIGSYWVCSEEMLPELREGFQELQDLIQEEKQLLIDAYNSNFVNFLERAYSIIGMQFYDEESRIAELERLSKLFPTKQEIAQKISCSLSIQKMPTIEESCGSIISDIIQNENLSHIKDLIEQDFLKARNIVLNSLTEYIEWLSNVDSSQLRNKETKSKFNSMSRQLSRLVGVGTAPEEIIQSLKDLHGVGKKAATKTLLDIEGDEQKLQEAIANLQEKLSIEKQQLTEEMNKGIQTSRMKNFSFGKGGK